MSIRSEKIPLSQLPALKTNLEGMLDAGNALLYSLEKAKSTPHVLDDAIVARIKHVYSNQQEEINLYQNLYMQWLKKELSLHQQENLKEFASLIKTVSSMNNQVFFLVDYFKEHTIDKILMKDEAALVTDMLTGKVFLPNGLDKVQHTLVPSKLIPCEKCGKLIAHLVFAENCTLENIEHHAEKMHPMIKKKNVDTWIIGEPLEIKDDDVLAYIMKVWPKKCKPKKILSLDFNHFLDKLEEMHC